MPNQSSIIQNKSFQALAVQHLLQMVEKVINLFDINEAVVIAQRGEA